MAEETLAGGIAADTSDDLFARDLLGDLDALLTTLDGADLAAGKRCLKQASERLFAAFSQGVSATALVHAQSWLIDGLLQRLWQARMGTHTPRLALVAVGGYGRGELCPHSDVDLLILQDGDDADPEAEARLKDFLALLWDVGLVVGHSVRTPLECSEQARADLTVITNLLEARLLCGSTELFAHMQRGLQPELLWSVPEFFNAKLEEQRRRYAKFDDTAYKLEPNVKESPGGLRDIQTIAWVTRRRFETGNLAELVARGFLSQEELNDLLDGRDFLWRVRFALHMVNQRREDRLLFEHQITLAKLFGYTDHSNELAVEQFMQRYYRTVKSLSCLNDVLLQLFEEAILHATDDDAVQPINERFQARHGYIEVTHADVFRHTPSALFEIFYLLQISSELTGIRAETLRLLRRDRHLIDDAREDIRVRAYFMAMLRHGNGLTRTLRRLNRYGLLGRYIPAFGRVIGRMQFDLFHTLTVDEHTLFVVRNLRRLAMQRFHHELPFCSDIMQRIARPELLYLAGFCHDIAKGRDGDHSELGAQDARELCLAHGISGRGSELVAWLVRNHLLMSMTAQRKDISDPGIIHEFARAVGSIQKLDHLFLLTVSDIRATNPTLWNAWRESLLTQLYLSARRNLEEGLDAPLDEEGLIEEARGKARLALVGMGIEDDEIQRLWSRFDADLFLRHSAQEIAWFSAGIMRCKADDLPLVMVDTRNERGALVFVYARDVDYLFGLLAGTLSQLGLSIQDARLALTNDQYTLDSYVVCEADNRPLTSRERAAEVRGALIEAIRSLDYEAARVTRRTPRLLRLFNVPTQVEFTQDPERERTIMELVSGDRAGLLSTVGRIFRKHQVLVQDAKINTIGERAEDVFFITGHDHRPLTNTRRLARLRQDLITTIDYEETQQ